MTLAISREDLTTYQELLRSGRMRPTDQAEAERLIAEVVREVERDHYRTHPVDWMVDKMGVRRETLEWSILPAYRTHEWDGTPDPFKTVADELAAGHDVGVESGTATGKGVPLYVGRERRVLAQGEVLR